MMGHKMLFKLTQTLTFFSSFSYADSGAGGIVGFEPQIWDTTKNVFTSRLSFAPLKINLEG